ncbi:MAG: hypothetical protein CMJ65_11395 [Planctomycetaceae bacterium]|nr:hypothetical protein [Planctomycetaceae bacterium]
MNPDSAGARHRSEWVPGLVILLVTVGVITAGVRIQRVLEASKPSTPILFDHGLTPLTLRAPSTWTNQQCGTCHPRAFEQWQGSRHAAAATNKKFRVECIEPIGGRRQWCINCHAPTNPSAGHLPTQEPVGLDSLFSDQPRWLVNGVDCLTCHVRDGKVLATRITSKGEAAHPLRLSPELETAEFCGGCHQFAFKSDQYGDEFHGQLQQVSMEEFLDFRRGGGSEQNCQNCHMPAGDHLMPGGYNNEMLKQSLDLDLDARWQDQPGGINVSISVIAQGVGHRLPGGEHFRFLSLHTNLRNADDPPRQYTLAEPTAEQLPPPAAAGQVQEVTDWPRIQIMRRNPGPRERGRSPGADAVPDTRLFPGERRTFRYFVPANTVDADSPLVISAELWYHKMGDLDARRFGFETPEVIHTVLRKEQAVRRGTGR